MHGSIAGSMGKSEKLASHKNTVNGKRADVIAYSWRNASRSTKLQLK